ncbi:uncharacterized protein LOC144708441 [Wolffia australiana]
MGDSTSSSVAPRKMKFSPKISPRKSPKTATQKPEESGFNVGDVLDRRLLRIIKKAESGSGRSPSSERKAASLEVTFGPTEGRSSVRSFGTVKVENTEQDNLTKPLAEEKKEDIVEPWDFRSYYPLTLPLRRPCPGNQERLDEEEFGESFSTAEEYDERKINAAKELDLLDGNAGRQMFFLQLPTVMPIKGEDMVGLVSKNSDLDDLPAGLMGKMLVYKSGAVKMKIGGVLFEVSPGSDCMFAQDVMAINTKKKQCCALGDLTKHVVVTPNIDFLLDSLI